MRAAFALLGVGFLTMLIVGYYTLGKPHQNRPLKTHTAMPTLTLTSSAFTEGGSIPSLYTCDGKNVNSPLSISGIPTGTQSLVLFVEDPDIPQAVKEKMHISQFDHFVLFNIPTSTAEIPEEVRGLGVEGNNTRGPGYTGPCPPTEYEPREHRYLFSLSALDTMLDLPTGASKDAVQKASAGHILETAVLIGRYKR